MTSARNRDTAPREGKDIGPATERPRARQREAEDEEETVSRRIREISRAFPALAIAAALCLAAAAPAEPGATGEGLAPDPAKGQGYFAAVCSTCHGVDASGIAQMGKDLRKNEFVATNQIPSIVKYIKTGHPPSAQWPEGMPPGGNSAYDDQQLADIAAWLKSLQSSAS